MDPKIERYLRENIGTTPLNVLKDELVRVGFPAADVEAAAFAIQNPAAPSTSPAVPAAPDARAGATASVPLSCTDGAAPPVGLSLGALPSNAVRLFTSPRELFAGLDEDERLSPALRYTFCWFLLCGAMSAAAQFIRLGPGELGFRNAGLHAFGVLIAALVGAVIFTFGQFPVAALGYGLLSLFGASSTFARTFRILSLTGPVHGLSLLLPHAWFSSALALAQAVLLGLAARARLSLPPVRSVLFVLVWAPVAFVGHVYFLRNFSVGMHTTFADVQRRLAPKEDLGGIAPRSQNDDPAYRAYAAGDFERARQLWLQSAPGMDPGVLYSLGTLYWTGRGTARDPAEAYKWYVLAAFMGEKKAGDLLARMRMELSPGEMQTGFDAAQSWLGLGFSEAFTRTYRPAGLLSPPAVAGRPASSAPAEASLIDANLFSMGEGLALLSFMASVPPGTQRRTQFEKVSLMLRMQLELLGFSATQRQALLDARAAEASGRASLTSELSILRSSIRAEAAARYPAGVLYHDLGAEFCAVNLLASGGLPPSRRREAALRAGLSFQQLAMRLAMARAPKELRGAVASAAKALEAYARGGVLDEGLLRRETGAIRAQIAGKRLQTVR